MDRNTCWQVVWLDDMMAKQTGVLFARVENNTNMMMSWDGDAFHITGSLWGESTGGFPYKNVE